MKARPHVLFGATLANLLVQQGRRCLVIDRRRQVAGNCYTELVGGIHVHRYGPHIFHTSDERIWSYVSKFSRFNHFTYRPRAYAQGRIYSFPINLMTLYQVWGVRTPAEAEKKLQEVRVPYDNPRNLEEYALSQVGEELYELFFRGYTTKQWGRDPRDLPASIIRRLPIRLTFDDNYFIDCYQGIPVDGYTALVERMLEGIEVILGCDYFGDRHGLSRAAQRTVFTGRIDQFFDCRFGPLEYRSLHFEEERHQGDFQGVAVVNYTDLSVPYTRIIEHKHFTFGQQSNTVVTREYPIPFSEETEPLYPVNDTTNKGRYERYRDLALRSGVLFGGRLGMYKYYDMHQVIAQAMALARAELS
jgi:UDP-galactopyranose mutase